MSWILVNVLWGLTGALLWLALIGFAYLPLWLRKRAQNAAEGQAGEAPETVSESKSEAA